MFGMLFWIMLPWHEFFEHEVAPFWWLLAGFTIGGVFLLCLATKLTTVSLRYLFRQCGMLTAEQAKFYPLRARKLYIDPWPSCWQEPCPRQLDTLAQPNTMDIRDEPAAAPDCGGIK